MHPVLQALLMAARGHTGLPPQIRSAPAPGTAAGIGGATPAPLPTLAAPAVHPVAAAGSSDRVIARDAATHLLAAAGAAHDPQLQAVFSKALTALHSYLASDQKEHQQALAGKLSPRILSAAYAKKAA